MSPDQETAQVLSIQQHIKAMVGSDGWRYTRTIFTDKILDLQNAFNIEDADATKMIIDLQARKLATQILFDVLQHIEGEAASADENLAGLDRSHIFRV